MPRSGPGAQLALDIGFDPATLRRVKGADIDNTHGYRSSGPKENSPFQ